MINKLLPIPFDIWITYEVLGETVIERQTVFQATYDHNGYTKLRYKDNHGNKGVWSRAYSYEDIFETKQQAIDSVVDGNYHIMETISILQKKG